MQVNLAGDYDENGTIDYTASTTTVANGAYAFTGLPAGLYTVTVDTSTLTSRGSFCTRLPTRCWRRWMSKRSRHATPCDGLADRPGVMPTSAASAGTPKSDARCVGLANDLRGYYTP